MRTAVTSRRAEASFGKRAATRVLRLIWVLSVSARLGNVGHWAIQGGNTRQYNKTTRQYKAIQGNTRHPCYILDNRALLKGSRTECRRGSTSGGERVPQFIEALRLSPPGGTFPPEGAPHLSAPPQLPPCFFRVFACHTNPKHRESVSPPSGRPIHPGVPCRSSPLQKAKENEGGARHTVIQAPVALRCRKLPAERSGSPAEGKRAKLVGSAPKACPKGA